MAILVAAIILCLNPIWPLWGGKGTAIAYCLLLVLFRIKISSIIKTLISLKYLSTFVFLCICFLIHPLFTGFHVSNVFIIMSFLLALGLDETEKVKALDILTKILACIIGISLPAWLIHVFIFEFPSFGEIDNSELKGSFYPMNNYLLFVTMATANTFRFYSMFDEPGVLGTLSAFVLFANRYDFKQINNLIILIGAFFSFSLAFYILTFIGYLFQSVQNIRKILLSIFSVLLVVFAAYSTLKDNLAFQYSVIERISSGGVDNLDNRTGDQASRFYDSFISTPEALMGIGYDKMMNKKLKEGQSYKLFIIEYGLLSIVCLLISYYVLAGRKNMYIYVLCLIFILSFLQRPFAFSAWQILIFSCATATLRKSV
ncbi:hypothetical protein [Phocaeicola sp.]|uniref:hypothetical protein n=1 Tax=Phocaeicola sp. TaxID=2773926 RepID=UPI0023C07E29|nr:hypothetical protein [Phocaeicola sp.]MDE5678734.1 hypothetical protein [Phocaeicola sp.]